MLSALGTGLVLATEGGTGNWHLWVGVFVTYTVDGKYFVLIAARQQAKAWDCLTRTREHQALCARNPNRL